jgi:uncharacterized integral membrane protein (TIGR00698 family)
MKVRIIFFLGIILAASGLFSAPVALVCGIIFGFSFPHPYHPETRALSRFLLQASVVGLGFGMNLAQVVHAGRSGFLYTAISISVATVLGLLLGWWFGVTRKASFLITMGTAICGGSAIAALAPVTQANDDEIAVSMGTVFALNSVALLLFPFIGHRLNLTQTQFGLWAALAIHDTSSVVGAAAKYGQLALQIGTTVKLARALWIVPVSLVTAFVIRRRTPGATTKVKIQWPWFILFFCIAAVLNSYLPQLHALFEVFNKLGKTGLVVTLFLIGTGLSRQTFQQVGLRPMLQGILLWMMIGTASLMAIHAGWIAL